MATTRQIEAGTTRSPKVEESWGQYLRDEVTASWGDAVLIVGCFATGLLDSAVFNVWSCFVSMQTGEHRSMSPAMSRKVLII